MLDDTRDHPQKPATAPAQNSEAPGPGRHPNSLANLERHKFQPGQSGNPGGRPKKAKEIAEKALDASDLALSALIKALEVETAKDEPNPQIVTMLADRIMNRGLGKPGQSIDVNQTTSFPEDFESFIRRLNDKNDVAAQRLQIEAAADVEYVDFEALERGGRD